MLRALDGVWQIRATHLAGTFWLSSIKRITVITMASKIEFPELGLPKEALLCFAVATLRMMDLDILASNSQLQKEKIAGRELFLKSFESYKLPSGVVSRPHGLEGELHSLLKEYCSKVRTVPNKVAILTELSFVRPWQDIPRVFTHVDIDESVKRLALKEAAEALNLDDAPDLVDSMIDEYFDAAKSAIKEWSKIIKTSLFATVGGLVGGLFLAPHVGAAIGGAMGLSGAAATSAGLAAIGGGALTAGGLGMFGGTIIIGVTSGLAVGATGGITQALASSGADGKLESRKLYVMLRLLNDSGEKVLVERVSNFRRQQADLLKDQRINEESKSKEIKDKKLIKRLESEEKMMRAVIP